MSVKRITIILAVAGVLIGLVSLLADVIGLGSSPGFGRRQLYGVVAGLLILAVAFHRLRLPESQESQVDVIEPAQVEADTADKSGE